MNLLKALQGSKVLDKRFTWTKIMFSDGFNEEFHE